MSTFEEWSRAGWRAHLPGVTDVAAFVGGLGEATIPELAAASASRVPGRVAVTVDGEPVTHAELDAGAARVAAWLTRRIEPGDRVLIAAGRARVPALLPRLAPPVPSSCSPIRLHGTRA